MYITSKATPNISVMTFNITLSKCNCLNLFFPDSPQSLAEFIWGIKILLINVNKVIVITIYNKLFEIDTYNK